MLNFKGDDVETKYQIPAKFGNKLERQDFWAKIFADQAVSGLSAKKFCQLNQLLYSTYKGNKYRTDLEIKLKTKVERNITTTKSKISNMQYNNHATKFLPLQITASDATSQDAHPTVIDQCKLITTTYNTTSDIQIIFKNDHRLILPATIPEAQLLSIINYVAGLLC